MALILSASAVTLQTSDGAVYDGKLSQLDESVVVLDAADGSSLEFSAGEIARVVNSDVVASASTAPSITVSLKDGSVLGAVSFELGTKADIGIAGKALLRIDPRNLRTVRFQKPSHRGPLDQQWTQFAQRQAQGDLLIVRKGKKLSFLEGMVRSVNARTIDFVFDNDDFAVKRANVEGLCFLNQTATKKRPSQIVYTVGSSVLRATEVRYEGEQLRVTLVAGDVVSLPLGAVRSIDFGASQVVYLSTLEPYKTTVTPRLSNAALAELSNRLIYRPAMNKSLSGGQLSLPSTLPGGARRYYDNGMALHSRTELIYRIEDGDFKRLQAIAGIDPDLRQQGTVRLEIDGDDTRLLEADLGPGDAAIPIDVSVKGVRRLRILVDYGDTSDAGDHLNLCEIRLTQ